MKKGKLYGIGVGPGDSKLLTVKAVETIQNADIIITPKTEKKEGSVAFNIAKPYISVKTAILPMVFQMNTDMDAVEKQWKENRKIIRQKSKQTHQSVKREDKMNYCLYSAVIWILQIRCKNAEQVFYRKKDHRNPLYGIKNTPVRQETVKGVKHKDRDIQQNGKYQNYIKSRTDNIFSGANGNDLKNTFFSFFHNSIFSPPY